MFASWLSGKKPPEDIKLNARFNELNALTEKTFKIKKITSVRNEYNRKIFIACLKISLLSNDK